MRWPFAAVVGVVAAVAVASGVVLGEWSALLMLVLLAGALYLHESA